MSSKQYQIKKWGNGYMSCIELDKATVKKLTAGGNKRVTCTLNKTITLHAAIMRTKEDVYYIMIAAKYLKQLKLGIGGMVDAVIKKDQSELQFNVPDEFAEVFVTDPEAKKIFDTLTLGNKRGLIALVNRVKSSDKKITRALQIAEKLKLGITSPQKMMK